MASGLPVNGVCQVWWAPATEPDDPALLALLDQGERRRHEGMRHGPARRTHLTARAVTRLVLGDMLGVPARSLSFGAVCRTCGGPHGKPVLRSPAVPVRFSVSHSGGWCVVAFALGVEVGVDVEQIRLRGDMLPVRALAPGEREVLAGCAPAEREAAFIRYWTRKEALLKATGDGLASDPAAIAVSPPDRPAALLSWDVDPAPPAPPHLTDLAAPPGYAAALAALGRPLTVSLHDGSSLLRPVAAPTG